MSDHLTFKANWKRNHCYVDKDCFKRDMEFFIVFVRKTNLPVKHVKAPPPSNVILLIIQRRYSCCGSICLCFGVEFLCCLNFMYVFVFFILVKFGNFWEIDVHSVYVMIS